MIDPRYAETLGFKRMDGEPEEHFEKRVRRLAYHAQLGTVSSIAEVIEDSCWNVSAVGHRSRIERTKLAWWQRACNALLHPWPMLVRYEPAAYVVEEFAVVAKRGTEPDHGAIHLAVDGARPAGVSMKQIELHYFEALP